MTTAEIRAILRIIAPEFAAVSDSIIDANIEITLREVDRNRIDSSDLDLATALLTAHNYKITLNETSGRSGSIVSEKIGDEQVSYANNTATNGDGFSATSYGKR